MTTNEQISHELRANLNRVITILRPYECRDGINQPSGESGEKIIR
jgi:hypothetical protein